MLQTANGQFTIKRALFATDVEVLNLGEMNPRSSFLNLKALAQIADWTQVGQLVVCIAYNDRPVMASRLKAKSRAEHACRIAAAAGAVTKVFV